MRAWLFPRSTAARLLVLAAVLGVAACGGPSRAPVGLDENRTLAAKTGPEPPVSGWMFANVGERTLGPFFARRHGAGAAGLAAWVTVAEGNGRRILVVPTDARGAPRGGESAVANVSVDTTMLVVRTMRGPVPGFAIAWVSLTDRGKSLWIVAVDDAGTARGKPIELTRTTDDIVWIDIVPTEHGAICLWAEETRGGDANLVAASLNTDARVRSAATRVAQGVVGWHALELPTGLGLSTVAASKLSPSGKAGAVRPDRDVRPGGALSFQRFDADLRAAAPPIAITPRSAVVSGDVEVARDAHRLLFAWTDRSGEESTISMAALDDKDVVEPARRVAEAHGGASLLALVSGSAGAALMYEAPSRRKGETRRVHLSRVSPALTLDRKPFSIDVVGRGQPELAATSTGFALLATTADCEPDAPACLNASVVATVLRTDAKAKLVQREPLTFLTDPATLGWGMSCEVETCYALAASPGPPGTPSRIRTAAIRPRANAKAAPPPAVVDRASKEGPRVVDITAVASGESVTDIATAKLGEATLVALLSSKSEANARKAEPGEDRRTSGVTLSTRLVSTTGDAASAFTITTRALPVGGVAVAPAEKPEDGAAVAWVSRESGDAEVHVTRTDKRGKRLNDVQITTAKGDASDVTITWAGNGWIVAWVDWRDGNGEVYATKVGLDLSRGREERITNAPGDASDLVALAHGTDVWLAWADGRESPKDGVADIFVSAVKMQNAKRVFDEQQTMSTAAHSRTPHLAANAEGVLVAWIEEAPMGSETPGSSGYGAFLARLDAHGAPAGRPERLALDGEGAATSVAIDASTSLWAVIARSAIDGISLDAIDLSTKPARAATLLSLDGPPSLDVSLVLDNGVLFFNDEGPSLADRRARRARIAWTR